MDDITLPDRRKKWFLWGMMLAGVSSIPLLVGIIGVLHALREVSETKATGLGAVAGGFAEIYSVFGLVLALLIPLCSYRTFGKVVGRRAAYAFFSGCVIDLLVCVNDCHPRLDDVVCFR